MSAGLTATGFKICINTFNRENFEQVEVGLGDTVNVTLGGVPPFNLTTSIYSPSSGLSTCETSSELLDQNWYVWTVEPVIMNGSSTGQDRREEREFRVLDDEVYLTATELNGTDVNGTDYHRFTGSPKYKIQAESSSASRCSTWNPKHFYLAALLVVPALFSL